MKPTTRVGNSRKAPKSSRASLRKPASAARQPRDSGSTAGQPRVKRGARLTEPAPTPRIIVRTPYPTLEQTAATLGISPAKARRIAALVRTELLRRNPVTGALEVADLPADSRLAHELVTRKVSPKTPAGLTRGRRRINVAP